MEHALHSRDATRIERGYISTKGGGFVEHPRHVRDAARIEIQVLIEACGGGEHVIYGRGAARIERGQGLIKA